MQSYPLRSTRWIILALDLVLMVSGFSSRMHQTMQTKEGVHVCTNTSCRKVRSYC